MSAEEGGAGAQLKGLRLITIDRGPEGFGFHMYTNKTLSGQYVKWVSPNGPADLSGMLAGDHVLEVDGLNVVAESHAKVVERIRLGDGRGKKLLVIDKETEEELARKGDDMIFDVANALVMIPRAPIRLPQEDFSPMGAAQEEVDGSFSPPPLTMDMSAALPPKKNTRRAQVKTRDWRSSIQAYNEL